MNSTIQIRPVSIDDTKELVAIYAHYVLNTTITFEYDVPSIEEFKERIIKTTKKYPYIVATKGNEIVGYAYATSYKERQAYDWSVETTVYVKDSEHSKGIGKLLYTQLESELKNKQIVNMLACITYPNPKSIEFHTKFGFTTVGHFPKVGFKFDEWRDIIWMQKVIN